MRKAPAIFSLLISCSIAVTTFPVSAQAADPPIAVKIDGQLQSYEQPPLILQGSTLVPMRPIFEALGANVIWDDKAKAAIATKYGQKMVIPIGSKTALVNGQTQTLEQEATIVDNFTMVPARFISESLGAQVQWDASTRTVSIVTPASVQPQSVPSIEEMLAPSFTELPKLSPPSIPPKPQKAESVPHVFKMKREWKTFNTKYFQIYYYGNENDIFTLSQHFDPLYEQLSERFGNKLTFLVPVYFLSPADYVGAIEPDWSSASWSPKEQEMFIRTPDKKESLEDLIITFKHELTHALTVSSLESRRSQIPTWFAEGAATYYEQEAPYYEIYRHQIIYDAYKKRTLLPWKQFETSNKNWKKEDLSKIYAQAQSIYGYLVETYGEAKINGLFFSVRPFAEELTRITGKSKARLENDWNIWLAGKMSQDAVYPGILYYGEGTRYVGEIRHGTSNGNGKLFRSYKLEYAGEFKESQFDGTGIYNYSTGGKYEGQFVMGKMTGKGRMYDKDGRLFYEGELKDGHYSGIGIAYFKDGTRYEGEFENDKPSGAGKLYDSSGKIIREYSR
ncbi:stalk domain-containing protein [Paenibacillus hamazuiensis]|uniref:stalk domain-containing protein n=1 Tax=Paenibacillus hamazuiensis TaxID=2936508 RepID=UPI00200F850A|nr:stalk domain-containing protein [Paenibacillus hamazuiensis]